MMRSAWVAPSMGSTVLALFTFVMEHGTSEQALEASRIVNQNIAWFQGNRLRQTNLDLCAEPAMLVIEHDVVRALDYLREHGVAR